MRVTRFFIDNYQFTIIVYILLLAGGAASFFSMPRMENPALYISGGSVLLFYPGAGPADLENLVAIPVEEAINEIEDIRKINTSLRDGVASISVEFEHGTDAREKYSEMVSRINSIEADLPGDIHHMEFIQWTSTDVAIMQIALISETVSFHELDRLAEALKRRIETTPGVKKVDIHAIPSLQLRVLPDMEKMNAMNIQVEQVIKAIESNNANVPGGTLTMEGRSFGIKTSGSFDTPDDLRRTVVGASGGQLVYLENIADVIFDYEDINYQARYRGQRAAFITVLQKENVNIFDITAAIDNQINAFNMTLDENVRIGKVFDQSDNVERRINGFLRNLYQGILLVGLLVFLSIGFRSSVIVIMAIPLSVIIGLGIVDLTGHALEQISIAALVVALGLLVDNSIVMVENLNRFLKMGYPAREASLKAVSEIGWPVTTATITTLIAFIPIILLPDKAGDFIRSLPVTIIATLTISLFITLTLSPFIASRFFRQESTRNNSTKRRIFERFIDRVVKGPYSRVLEFSIRREFIVLLLALFIVAISVYAFTRVGISYFPKAETPQLAVLIELPEGADLESTDKAARYVEQILDTISGVRLYAGNIGKGNPRIYYNHFPKPLARNFAEIYVELDEFKTTSFNRLVEQLRSMFSTYPGAHITVKEFEQGMPMAAPVVVYITGEEIDELRIISRDVEEFLASQPGAVNIENMLDKSQTDMFFNINRGKAGILGVPVHEINRTIRMAVNGILISKFRDRDGRQHDIIMRLPAGNNVTHGDLDRVFVSSLSGRQIPLRQLVSVEFVTEPSLVTRFNMQRNASIHADIKSGFTLDAVTDPLIGMLDNYPFPEGYGYYIAGELESRKETFGGMRRAVLIAIISIFGVLVFQFRSFSQPLIIFSAIPLAVIGSIWMLLITGNTFSFTAFIGLISLIGIVINNSIILVDFTNRLRDEGMDIDQAIMEAGKIRFLPIVLTSVTTIGGLLPLTLAGGTLWAPMGWTIIGGLLSSTALTLIVVPVLYKLFSRDTRGIMA
jgi:multidrug efflux pump subunit AcrB